MAGMTIQSMQDVMNTLQEYYISSGIPAIGTGFRIENTYAIAERVGSPHERLKVVHVAGTSGKTSTSYYLAALLRGSGVRVGLTVSPHIEAINDRVQLDGVPISNEKFVGYFAEYLPLATDNFRYKPSFFELMMVFALWVFDRENVDYAVVETGMGGLYDSSNICRRGNKVCVLTDIGFDHTHVLGNTLEEIAVQKAGIIADTNAIFIYRQPEAIMGVVNSAISQHNASVYTLDGQSDESYFERNFRLAKRAIEFIVTRDALPALTPAIIQTARQTRIPGRLEEIRVGNTMFVLDGAHNEQKMRMMLATLQKTYGDTTWDVIVALKHGKDIQLAVNMLQARASSITATEYTQSQDMPVSPVRAVDLAKLFLRDGSPLPVRSEPDLITALKYSMAHRQSRILITGSFYAVSEARAWLIQHKHGIVEA